MPTQLLNKHHHQKKRIIEFIKNNLFDQAEHDLNKLIQSYPGDHELYYMAGMLYGAQSQFVAAQASFEKALNIQPEHEQSLFELGIIHLMLCRFNKAMDYFQQTRDHAHKTAETNAYLNQIQKKKRRKDVTLSVCLIVKNEEKYLPQCLNSVQAVADEIIVVDTGSKDKTIELAEKYGSKVFPYQWKQDFAAARNFAKSQATGDWILQIDADEELFPEDQTKVREFIQQDTFKAAFIEIRNKTTGTFGENQPVVHYLIRLFKNQKEIYYVNPIHETLEISGNVAPTDIKILHHGYNSNPQNLKNKRNRNANILHKKLKADPNDIVSLFYLSMLHLGNLEFDISEKYALRILEILTAQDINNQHIYLMTLKNLALINIEKMNYKNARPYCRKALEINGNYLEPQFLLGLSYFREENYSKSKKWFLRYLNQYHKLEKQPVFNLFAQTSKTYLYQVYHLLGKIYRKEKKYSKAQKMLLETVTLNPNFWIGFADLGYLNLELNEFLNAATYLETAINIAKNNPEVNKNNKMLWFDYLNAVKHFLLTIKKLPPDQRTEKLESLKKVESPK